MRRHAGVPDSTTGISSTVSNTRPLTSSSPASPPRSADFGASPPVRASLTSMPRFDRAIISSLGKSRQGLVRRHPRGLPRSTAKIVFFQSPCLAGTEFGASTSRQPSPSPDLRRSGKSGTRSRDFPVGFSVGFLPCSSGVATWSRPVISARDLSPSICPVTRPRSRRAP